MSPRAYILAFFMLWAALAPAQAQQTLTPPQARLAAHELIQSGRALEALDIVEVLLARDGADVEALILRSRALRFIGQHPQARAAARTAWQTAEAPDARYAAAMAMAQALSSGGDRTRAQIWLRRAAHHAPIEALRNRAARDLQYVRAQAKLSTQLSFGVAPSNNVNNAPRDNTFNVGSITLVNPTAVPIAGVTVHGGAQLRYRFAEGPQSQTSAIFGLSQSEVYFTDDTVPAGVSAGDFRQQNLTLGVQHDFRLREDGPRHHLGLTTGRMWYGGSYLKQDVTLSYGQTHTPAPDRILRWSGRLGYSDRQDSALRSGWTGSVSGLYGRALASGAQLAFTGGLSRVSTDSAVENRSQINAGIAYTLAKPVMGAQTELGLQTAFAQYDDAVYGPLARNDTRLGLAATFFFTELDIYGFAPTLRVNADRTFSNITRFDTESLGVSVGIKSVF